MKNKLSLKNLIHIGVYAVFYFVLVALAAVFCVFIIPLFVPYYPYPYVFIPAVAALLTGAVYMLLIHKTQNFGAVSLLSAIMAIFFLFVFPWAALVSIIIGVIADLIAKAGNYQDQKIILLCYIIFAFNLIGPVLPLFLFPEYFTQMMQGRGRTLEQIHLTLSVGTLEHSVFLVILIIICALLGGWFGQKLISKHFQKVS